MPDSANNFAPTDRGLLAKEGHSILLETRLYNSNLQKRRYRRTIKLQANHTPTGSVQGDICSCHTQQTVLIFYLGDNDYIDKHVQKGFWPSVDGVFEHTQMLAHMMREVKRHQRTMIVTLLDLRNAFGEVNHGLIYSSLRYHNVPEEIISIIKDIYTNSTITVAHGNTNSELIHVERGVL